MNRKHQILGIAGIALLGLTACADNSNPDTGTGDETKRMVFVGAGGSYQEAQTIAFIDPFVALTGAEVTQDQPYSLAKVKTMVESNRTIWDVMEVDPYLAMGENCGLYFEPIDFSRIDTTGVIMDMASECVIPNMQSAYLFVYNSETYAGNEPTSWADFFDVEKFPGKRGIMDYADQGALEIALIADGVAPEDVYPIDYERAFAKLDTIRDHTTFLTTGAEQQEALERGAVDMMLSWPGRAYGAAANGAPLATVWNQAMLYWDGFSIPKNAPNIDTVYEFLNLAVSPEAQAKLTENTAYGPINTLSEPDVDDVKFQFLPLPENSQHGFLRDMGWWGENMDEATLLWTNWVTS